VTMWMPCLVLQYNLFILRKTLCIAIKVLQKFHIARLSIEIRCRWYFRSVSNAKCATLLNKLQKLRKHCDIFYIFIMKLLLFFFRSSRISFYGSKNVIKVLFDLIFD